MATPRGRDIVYKIVLGVSQSNIKYGNMDKNPQIIPNKKPLFDHKCFEVSL